MVRRPGVRSHRHTQHAVALVAGDHVGDSLFGLDDSLCAPAACVAKLFETTCYLPPRESDHLRAALDFAAAAHDGQRRKSGEAFIIHPVEVATILAELRMNSARSFLLRKHRT